MAGFQNNKEKCLMKERTEAEVEQIFTVADLRAQIEKLECQVQAERIARVAVVDSLVEKIVDNTLLARQVDELTARVAELADENQLLRDDAADAPVPFRLATPVPVQVLGGSRHLAAVIPPQRDGEDS